MTQNLSLNHKDIISRTQIAFSLVSIIPVLVIFYMVQMYGPYMPSTHRNLVLVSIITAAICALGWHLIRGVNRDVLNKLVQQEKLTALGQLAAGVAHEINNPLCIVLGNVQLLSKEAGQSGYKGTLDIIENEIDRCARIVSDLLEFSRHVEPEFREVDINGLLDGTLSLISHQLLIQDIHLIKEYGHNFPHVIGDGNRLKQVFMNIIVNACQAMEGGGTLTISTCRGLIYQTRTNGRHKCRPYNFEILKHRFSRIGKRGFIEVRISDTGCGIKEEDMQHLFEPFWTTRKPDKGTGLGLSLSYGIIRQHKGDIKTESKIGEGTTFTIRLPV